MDNLCEELKNFGHNFTSKRHFNGEPAQLEEQPHISEEEYYCFDRQTRVTHINVSGREAVKSRIGLGNEEEMNWI